MKSIHKAVNPNVKRVGMALGAIAALFAIYIYASYNPENTFFPKCPFFWATGLKCPGCGSQRAFRYNACLVLSIPLLVFLLGASLFRSRFPKLYAASHHPALSWTVTALILLWWLFRNIFGW